MSSFLLSLLQKFYWHLIDYIAFGPHGPREPLTKPGHGMKVVGGVSGVIAASAALFYAIRVNGNEIKEMKFKYLHIFL